MEGYCSTCQNPQWAVVPMEEEEVLSRKKTSKFSLYNTQRLVFITEEISVHCAVETGSLTEIYYVSSLRLLVT
jgi:hypothetical protein